MNSNAFLVRVATLLPDLPPSPLRSLIAAILVNADATALFDQVARIYFLEGLFGLPATGRTSLSRLKSGHAEEAANLPTELFDPRANTGLYRTFFSSVKNAIHDPQQAEEAAQNIFAGITPGKGKATDPIFYSVGKVIRQRGAEGVTISSIKNAVSKFAAGKAHDYGKLRKSPTEGAVGFDSPLGEDSGRTLADILADTSDYTLLQTVFDTPAGAKVLRRLSETVERALPSEGQKMVWQAILRKPDLIGSRSESVAGADLARSLAGEGYNVTPQRAGQLWRDVLKAVRTVAALNPDVLAELEDTQLVKRMLDPRNLGKTARLKVADKSSDISRLLASATKFLEDAVDEAAKFEKALKAAHADVDQDLYDAQQAWDDDTDDFVAQPEAIRMSRDLQSSKEAFWILEDFGREVRNRHWEMEGLYLRHARGK